ncbi:MAG: LL-diaminopimelate aminotransferase [Nitrospirae bacterium RBG_13_39_12]|nr:MAG: LL-diaminopimelate aminotransferase [Nitrospirae bacterium RBG_13_39_12]
MKKKLSLEPASRIKHLPPYLFASIDKMKQKAIEKDTDLIDLSIGDPDIPTPSPIINAMKKAVTKPANHRYPSYEGMFSFREAVSAWYKKRFGAKLDPHTEVLSLIGSKEGIGHIPLAFINPGDTVLVPSPGYPVYSTGTLFAGGKSYIMPLKEENDFLPDFDLIPEKVLSNTKLIFINYPNNPTSATVPINFYKEVVTIALKYNIIVCHDASYTEIYYDKKPLSFMQTPGAKEVGIEFHSLSKTYNMTGWRIGFAVGNRDVLAGLGKVKTNLDSGVFQAIQEAAVAALNLDNGVLSTIRKTYRGRRDILYNGLKKLGVHTIKPKATFYIWAKVPSNFTSMGFVTHLLDKAGVLATPGNGFGDEGEGYIRFALTAPAKRIREAVDRIQRIL